MGELKKQFLDYNGLSKFWNIIYHKFANKTDAVKVESFSIENRTTTNFDIAYTDSNDTTNGTAAAKGYAFTLPAANETQAGLLSAEHFSLIDDIDNKINEAAPFHGLKIEGNEIARDGAKRANIGLDFVTEGSVTDGTRKAYIDLVDLNYPETGNWTEITSEEYDAHKAHHTAYTNGGTTTYWAWSVENANGPVNNLGEPLYNRPVSRIDVSELVKAGLLQDADVVYRPESEGVAAGMYLKFIFITNGEGTETKEVYINVTDLVDIYSEGEGIEITNDAMNSDTGMETGSSRTGTIKVRVATNTTLGAVKVGFDDTTTDNKAKQNYKVQLDATGNAYVAVPWEHTSVNVTTEEQNAAGEKYLVVTQNNELDNTDDNGIPTPSYNFNIEVGDGIKNAEKLAGTSVQSITVGTVSEENGAIGVSKDEYIKISTEQMTRTVNTVDGNKTINYGTKVVASLTDSAEASLGLADTSVQNVTTATVERGDTTHTPAGEDLVVSIVELDGNTTYNNTKGEKTIKVTLGDKTVASLDKADTAIQTIQIFDTTLNIDSAVYEVDDAKKSLSLGTASNVNIVDIIPEGVIGNGEGQLGDDVFKSNVATWEGPESRYTTATTKAVKTYVDNQNNAQTEELQNFVISRINELDTVDNPGVGEHAHVTAGKTEAVYNYVDNTTTGGTAQQIIIQVGQTDGVLDNSKTITHTIGIQDIADFAPLSEDDINTICGIINAE